MVCHLRLVPILPRSRIFLDILKPWHCSSQAVNLLSQQFGLSQSHTCSLPLGMLCRRPSTCPILNVHWHRRRRRLWHRSGNLSRQSGSRLACRLSLPCCTLASLVWRIEGCYRGPSEQAQTTCEALTSCYILRRSGTRHSWFARSCISPNWSQIGRWLS